MTAQMRKTKRLVGLDDDTGAPVFAVTMDSGEDEPAGVAVWVERRREALAGLLWMPAAQAAIGVLEGSAEAKAAGKPLTADERYAVSQVLAGWKQLAASGYGPAVALAGRVSAEWDRCWGSEPPKQGRAEPPWRARPVHVPLDRPLAETRFGCAPVTWPSR